MSKLFTDETKNIMKRVGCDMKTIVPFDEDGVHISLYIDCEPIAECDGKPHGVVRIATKRNAESFVKALLDQFLEIMDNADRVVILIENDQEDYVDDRNYSDYQRMVAGKLFTIAEEMSMKCCENDVFGEYNDKALQERGYGLYKVLFGVNA